MSYQRSTSVLKENVLTICGELTDGTSDFDAQAVSYLDKVYQGLIAGNNLFDMSCAEPWVWAQSRNPILLTLNPSVTGSAVLTQGELYGTFSAAPSISLEGRYLSLDGQSDIYRISQHDANDTSFFIDQAYLSDNGTYNYSAFKYDYDAFNDVIIINSKNNKIDFTEGGAQLTATITKGSYSPDALCSEIKAAMEIPGAQTYAVTFNEITRKFTIAQGGASFSLLFGSGTNVYVSTSGVLGYDIEDQTGALTYDSQYALSSIVRLTKPITMYQSSPIVNQTNRDSNKIFQIDDNTFLRDYPINALTNAIPDKFCSIEQNPDGLWKLRFNASVAADTRIEVNHIPIARKLVDNVNSFPLVPGSFSDFLVYGAAHFIQVDKSDSKATDSLQKAQAQLKALIAFNRQGSQVAGNDFGRIIPRPCGINRTWGSGSAY